MGSDDIVSSTVANFSNLIAEHCQEIDNIIFNQREFIMIDELILQVVFHGHADMSTDRNAKIRGRDLNKMGVAYKIYIGTGQHLIVHLR